MKGKTTKYETHLSKWPKVSVVLSFQSQDKFGKCSEVDDAFISDYMYLIFAKKNSNLSIDVPVLR